MATLVVRNVDVPRDDAEEANPAEPPEEAKPQAIPAVGSVWTPINSPFALNWGDVTVVKIEGVYVVYTYDNGKESAQSVGRFTANAKLKE